MGGSQGKEPGVLPEKQFSTLLTSLVWPLWTFILWLKWILVISTHTTAVYELQVNFCVGPPVFCWGLCSLWISLAPSLPQSHWVETPYSFPMSHERQLSSCALSCPWISRDLLPRLFVSVHAALSWHFRNPDPMILPPYYAPTGYRLCTSGLCVMAMIQ